MNTIKSVWLGWGSLIVAGGSAYYFAKKSINADRAERAEAENKRRQLTERLEYSAKIRPGKNEHARSDPMWSPSSEASKDPAPTRHPPFSDKERVREKSKYEASEPYRTRKGDRFT